MSVWGTCGQGAWKQDEGGEHTVALWGRPDHHISLFYSHREGRGKHTEVMARWHLPKYLRAHLGCGSQVTGQSLEGEEIRQGEINYLILTIHASVTRATVISLLKMRGTLKP